MEDTPMTKEQIRDCFLKGINCCQCILREYADVFGFDPNKLSTLGSAFGGGMIQGDTCGAVTGSLMVLGLAYANDPQLLSQKVSGFQKTFRSAFETLLCRELIHYDFSVPGQLELAYSSGIMHQACPEYVETALAILDELLQDYYDTL